MMIGYKGKKMDFSMFVTFQVSDDSVLSLKDGLQVPKYNIDNFDVTTNGKRKSHFWGFKAEVATLFGSRSKLETNLVYAGQFMYQLGPI